MFIRKGSTKSEFLDTMQKDRKSKKNFGNLDLFLVTGFCYDEIVIPISSTVYGTKYDKLNCSLKSFTKNPVYKENAMNMKKLYDQGKMMLVMIPEGHDEITDYLPFLNNFWEDNCEFEESFSQVPKE